MQSDGGGRCPNFFLGTGRAEIEQDDSPLARNVDVARLDVAVKDVLTVNRLETVQNLPEDVLELIFRQPRPALVQILIQTSALDILHDDVGGLVRLQKIAHRDDIAMPKPGEMPGLFGELPKGPPPNPLLFGIC